MRIKHNYGISSSDKSVLKFLINNNINFQKDELTIVVSCFEDEDCFALIDSFMRKKKAVDVEEAVYQQTELDNAEWLTIKSTWWTQYPQPMENMDYLQTTYDASDYCPGTGNGYYCGKGLKQVRPFSIKKEPNWKGRHFMMLNWVPDELFVSHKVEEILSTSSLKGFILADVINKQQNPYSSVKQLYVQKYLYPGISADSVSQTFTCPICGFKKHITKVGPIKFKKELFSKLDCDIVKTMDKFGEIGCDSLIIVSRAFYNVIKEHKIGKGLAFEPIELV